MTAQDEKGNYLMVVKCLENGTLMKIYSHMKWMDGWCACRSGFFFLFFFFLFLFSLILFAHTCAHTHPIIIHVSIRSFSSASLRHAVFPMVQFCSTFKLNNNKNNRRHFNVVFSSFFLVLCSRRWKNQQNKR